MKILNGKIKALRNATSSPDAYPVSTKMVSIDEFLTTYGKPIKNETIGSDKLPSYCNIKTSEDALSEDLNKVCMAYDDVSDRGIVWVTEPNRVLSYSRSVLNGSHIGIIGLIDLKSNIKSFEELLEDVDWEDCEEEIKSEIRYWKSFYQGGKGHRYFVIVGKNRSLFAIPTIYAKSILEGKYNQYQEKFFVEVKVWTKYVTKSFKTELYRNEKNNMKDTPLMELIGWEAPITDMIHELTKSNLARKALPKMFDFDKRVLYQDRELVVDCYSLYCKKYIGGKNWVEQQFEKGLKIQKAGKVDFDEVWKLFLNVMYVYKTNTQKVKDSQTWKMLVFNTCLKYLNSPLTLTLKSKLLYTRLYELALETHIMLDDKSINYGFRSDAATLTFSELKSGMKGNSGYFKSDNSKLTPMEFFDETKLGSVYISKKQGLVLLDIWNNMFFELLQDENGVVIPAKRNFNSTDISYIVKRDSRMVRINGEVYNKNNEPIRFSDIYPDDPFIVKYGTESDYVTLPLIEIMSSNIQVDHIPPYSKNMDKKDLDKCELTSDTFNNWKNDREAIYESEVLEAIQEHKDAA